MHKKRSAGILLYRIHDELEVFLVHPGGPFWKNKEKNAWSIPKGEFTDDEDALTAAKREFSEETGINLSGEFIELGQVKLKSGKIVYAWAMQKNIDATRIISNNFAMTWPPNSGITKSFPEVDKASWFSIEKAKQKINLGQIPLLNILQQKLNADQG